MLSGSVQKYSTFASDDHRSSWLKDERLLSILKRIKKLEYLSNIPLISLSGIYLLNQKNIEYIIFNVKKNLRVDDLLHDIVAAEFSGDLGNSIINLFLEDYGLINDQHFNNLIIANI